MRVARWAPVAVAIVLLAGCGQSHGLTHSSTLQLTLKDVDKSFNVPPQAVIVAALSSHRGYRWKLLGRRAHVRVLSHRYVPSAESGPGGGDKEVWRFRATVKGTDRIVLAYVRLRGFQHASPVWAVTLHIR